MTVKIDPAALAPMDLFTDGSGLRIDLAYAGGDNLLFGEKIYRKGARLWLHEDLAKIVLLAARLCKNQGYRIILYDGLRTVDAQAKMTETQRVRDNPHWLEPAHLLSPPGAGAHPRGMAIDMSLETLEGKLLDMGTPFDFLAEDSSPARNPAHRCHPWHSEDIMENRKILTGAMEEAAKLLNSRLRSLPQEWWDFRLPPAVYEQYDALSDSDLPPQMRMTDAEHSGTSVRDFPESHFKNLKKRFEKDLLT